MIVFLYFVYGSCLASFLTLCAVRLANRQSIITPRSHCDSCKHQLQAWQLIPILGYLLQRGRCHFCHSHISALSTINELALGLFFSTLPRYFALPSLALICISTTLIFCTTTDVFYHYIYTASLVGFVPSLFILVNWYDFSLQQWLLLLATLLFLSFFALISHSLGIGDVELIILFQLLIGFSGVLLVIAISSLTAIIYFLISKHKGQLAFVPFLSFAFLFIVSFPELIMFGLD
ncbi:prepilin peptidase [Paucilactobacillus kaifaensis]|uniref:prepilin peptidase n=1 Tax=Paucilactobacillus kaifaensis TaxID=2559921 RepID=UPI0010F46134|nr:A24 family peptidase [Paucilactobacillus kaifaensis]